MHRWTAAVGVVAAAVLATATPATATELPAPLPAGRLAYSTAVYESSADGSSLSVHGLGTMQLDGSDQRTLTSPVRPSYDHSPDWSPDGRWLVAMRQLNQPESPTSMEIRVTSADGTSSQVVGYGRFPAWSPDGRTLAWASADPAKPGVLFLPVDTSDDVLTTDPSALLHVPTPRRALASAWDPRGGALAVWVDQAGDEHRRDLWLVDVAGGTLRQLVTGIHQDFHSIRPAWHPTGLQLAVIAAEAGRPGHVRAWLVAADGSSYSPLIPDGQAYAPEERWVSWAPHGLSLAVEAAGDVLLVSPAGQVLRTLEPDRLERPETPVWSPDGTHVYVVADERDSTYKPELWALPLVGDQVRQLTTDSSVFPTTATAVDPGLALRIIGHSPAETAIAVADGLAATDTVVLTLAANAAPATPLSTSLQAPLLQTFPDRLATETHEELQDSRPTTAWVVGQVSDAVEAQLRGLGVTTVHRLGGGDTSSVAAAVAKHVPATTAFLAPVEGSLEQSAAAAIAGARQQPLLLTGSQSLGSTTRAALHEMGVTRVHLTAADAAVSTLVDDELRALGISVQRLSGSSPGAAALHLAEAFAGTSAMDRPVIVPKDSPDFAGPSLAARRGTVLLPAGKTASDPVVRFIAAHSESISSVDLVAGPADLTPVLETAVERAVHAPVAAAELTRLSGPDRLETAIASSKHAWANQHAQSVVLARHDAFPDALAGTPLAVRKNGPLLLTPSTGLNASTATEIKRVLPAGRTVYLLGGQAALSQGVADAVTRLGYQVARLGGVDRYATAVTISKRLGTPSRIFEATGLSFQNALISGVAAAANGGVVVLTADAQMPAATRGYLDSFPGVERIAVGAHAGTADPSATKVAGATVYDTARLVAARFFPTPRAAAVASGTVFADALSGGAHIGRLGGPLLLSEPTRLPAPIAGYLSTHKASIDTVALYGGPAALSSSVEDGVRANLRQ